MTCGSSAMRMAAEQDTKFQEQSNKTAGLAVRIRTCLLLQVLTVTHESTFILTKNDRSKLVPATVFIH